MQKQKLAASHLMILRPFLRLTYDSQYKHTPKYLLFVHPVNVLINMLKLS